MYLMCTILYIACVCLYLCITYLAYEDQMVAFFRQPNVFDLISRRHSRGVRPQLRQAIEEIRERGIPALERIQLAGGATAVELTIILRCGYIIVVCVCVCVS